MYIGVATGTENGRVSRNGQFVMGNVSWYRLSAPPPKDEGQDRAGEQAQITDTEVRKGTLIGQ
jgi:hypothetical protein